MGVLWNSILASVALIRRKIYTVALMRIYFHDAPKMNAPNISATIRMETVPPYCKRGRRMTPKRTVPRMPPNVESPYKIPLEAPEFSTLFTCNLIAYGRIAARKNVGNAKRAVAARNDPTATEESEVPMNAAIKA